ncbi:hypothetical protein [Thiococcus pfennigii]|uniref:hypothetical protein n=1 Tax=Thiococcus pfennigii TaxID=1057 RepID=UPI001907E1E6|nr:hypothetical protein [Thiococcus pfennigii]MBK1699727.1 hypothetical protein [Thiococcus pfennigii]
MSITIEVYRGAGDRPGEDIVEPLLGDSLAAAQARGKAELNARATLMMSETLELVSPRPDLFCGALIEVNDPDQGEPWRGKVVGIAHALHPGEAPTTLTVERPIDVY